MSTNRRKAVFVLMMIFMYTKVLGIVGLGGSYGVYTGFTQSIYRNARCGPAYGDCGGNYGGIKGLISL